MHAHGVGLGSYLGLGLLGSGSSGLLGSGSSGLLSLGLCGGKDSLSDEALFRVSQWVRVLKEKGGVFCECADTVESIG
jgi:hypothetical protein